jgi:riboflavin kinase/FMN adenylyltransferase
MKNKITNIAIGGFDGMHLAHQEVFKYLDDNGGIVVIESGYANLTPKTYRAKFTKLPIFYYPLQNIKHLDGIEFIRLLKEEFCNLCKIVVGYDFRFGKDAKYSAYDLKKLFDQDVIIVKEFRLDGVSIHSRVIRNYLLNGNIKLANKFLGHNYFLVGTMIKGQGLGHKELVPTINLDVKDFLIPDFGVYATKTTIDNKQYLSATFIGNKISINNQFSVETYIIDEEIYPINKAITIEFFDKIRDIVKFDSLQKLKNQILSDIKLIKTNFKG